MSGTAHATKFLDRIDVASLPGDQEARQSALATFFSTGWPDRKHEAWHYTDLNARMRTFTDEALVTRTLRPELPSVDIPRLVFVDGVLDKNLSSDALNFLRTGRIPEQETGSSPIVALNAAITLDGADLKISAGQNAGTILLVSVGSADGLAIAPRHRITLEKGSNLTVIEVIRGAGRYLHVPVTEINVGDGGTLRHFRLQEESQDSVHVATILATLGESAAYETFTLGVGASLARSEFHVTLGGSGADVQINAAQLLTGAQHGDVTTIVAHDAPGCTSRQTVKSVIDGSARGVFQGRIEVSRIAQKTDGYQMNQALLLSDSAEIDSKPELEIFADDVKCSHGATIGALDPEQIFYLRSRGVSEKEARAILIRAFLHEALEPITDDAARPLFEAAIQSWRWGAPG